MSFSDIAERDAEELRDIAADFEARGKKRNAEFLRRLAGRHEIMAGAYDTAARKVGGFFAWFNRQYPEPSADPDHPWCVVGAWLSERRRHEDTLPAAVCEINCGALGCDPGCAKGRA